MKNILDKIFSNLTPTTPDVINDAAFNSEEQMRIARLLKVLMIGLYIC